MKYRYRRFVLGAIAFCLMAASASAAIIVTRGSNPATGYQVLGAAPSTQKWSVSWTQSFTSTGTDVHAFNLSNPSADHSVTLNFDLGTTLAANDVGSNFVTLIANGNVADALLFTGLTLGPAEYFLTAYVSGASTSGYTAIWHGGAIDAGYAAPGVTIGWDYADLDSTARSVGFQVEGTFTAVPEPACFSLLGLGLAALFAMRRGKNQVAG
ncbi:MAG: PEP-CTERM sorting domain-containing protein [Acidobacteria bacterium]|nr:PEP-CTERM sorting domain-containing protein [Acidobacteriota bacterium]